MRVSGKVGAGEDYMKWAQRKSGRKRKLDAEWASRKVGVEK